jgi:hypothetical protein
MFETDPSSLFLGLLFGAIGTGFFIYGKKQASLVPLICGLLLMVVPYFVPDARWLFAAGAALVVAPYFIRL